MQPLLEQHLITKSLFSIHDQTKGKRKSLWNFDFTNQIGKYNEQIYTIHFFSSLHMYKSNYHYKVYTYANPRSVEIGLVEAGDDIIDKVLGGAEPTSLPQQKRRFLIGFGIHVEDRFQVTVYPVISRHFHS